jgi:ketosteroid isomerase-like protein
MRTKRFSGLAVPIAVIAAACAPAATVTTPGAAPASAGGDVAVTTSAGTPAMIPLALRTAREGYVAAWNSGNPAAVGAYFTDDARATLGENAFSGRQEIVTNWLASTMPRVSNLAANPASFTPAASQVTETGHYTMSMGGQAVGGTYTIVWARQPDGSWRITSTSVGEATP